MHTCVLPVLAGFKPKDKQWASVNTLRDYLLALLARDYLQLLKMVGKFIGHCLNFPAIYTGEQ
jgi:hypothetical protein